MLNVGRFRFGNLNMAKIYERSLSTIREQEKFRDSFDPRSQTRSGEESTWKGDRLEIARVVDCFFFLFITRLTCFGCFISYVLFNLASVKIKLSTLSVHCYITCLVSFTEECLACVPQCLLRTFSLMSRIDLVSKNLLANYFRNCRKRDNC